MYREIYCKKHISKLKYVETLLDDMSMQICTVSVIITYKTYSSDFPTTNNKDYIVSVLLCIDFNLVMENKKHDSIGF